MRPQQLWNHYRERKGRLARTRELIVSPYVVAYRITDTTIEILSVIHSARQWSSSL